MGSLTLAILHLIPQTFQEWLSVFLFIILAYSTKFYYSYFTRYSPLPGPFPLPLIGTIYLYHGDLAEVFFNLQKKYGGIFELYNGPSRVIWVGDTQLIKKIHIPSTKTNFPFRSRHPWIDEVAINTVGKGIFFNHNLESWKYNRRILTQTVMLPSFLRQFLKTTEQVFKEFQGYLNNLQKESNSNEVDLSKWIVKIQAELSSRTTTGRPANTLFSYYNKLSSNSSKVLKIKSTEELIIRFRTWLVTAQFVYFLPRYLRFCPPLFYFQWKHLENIQWLDNYLTNLIIDRKKEIENTPKVKPLGLDILTIICTANTERGPQFNKSGDEPDEPMDDDNLKQNMFDDPIIKSKVYEEVDRVFGNDRSRPMTYEDLEKLTYIDACVSESLRLLPTIPALFKQATSDDNLGDFKFKGGQEFFINYHYVHHNETYWPDPTLYKPERFLDKNFDKLGYMPFGGGIRICPGRQMGLNTVKTIISLIFRNYTIDLIDPNAPLKKVYVWANECEELKFYLSPKN
ncbi:8381_t:CDS:2 [Cetraspora pellucida]|uniref:8381_t:CDS:1 n=1 Tax=Cetraspora pellucida TaxID=1433469 RepID=A0A9N9NN61_9GLOM|nr:8381_t:CDS:2 [Cetraspora pellucida]